MIEKTAIYRTEDFQLKLPQSFGFGEHLLDHEGFVTFSLRLSWNEVGIQGDMPINPGAAEPDGSLWDCFALTVIPGPEEYDLKLALFMRANTFFDNPYKVYETWNLELNEDEEDGEMTDYMALTNQSFPTPICFSPEGAEKELELAWKVIQKLFHEKFEFRIKE